jgi:NhaB family Na+:H+ antiporter
MNQPLHLAFWDNFLGQSSTWYKLTIIAFLVINPIVAFAAGPFIAGWLLIFEFIFTLAMALKCYPLQPGGLIAMQAVIIGLTTPESVYQETVHNFPVIMLLMFMVAGIYFLKEMLLLVFTKILLGVRSKKLLSLLFCALAAFLSAFLDALTVTAVVISVAAGFYGIYHKVASGKGYDHSHDETDDAQVQELHRKDLDQFRAFLRNLMMHAAIGTALGGVTTLVGEPQNLLIAKEAGWDFMEFFYRMAPVSMPVLVVGLLTCLLLETFKWFSYGAELRPAVRDILRDFDRHTSERRTTREKATIIAQDHSSGINGGFSCRGAGQPSCRGGRDRPGRYCARNSFYRSYGRTSDWARVPGSFAVYRLTGCVFCNSSGNRSTGIVYAGN